MQDLISVRSDIFRLSWGSVFDLLVRLDKSGEIELAYHYDADMETHVIDAIDGLGNWWYEAHYSGGNFEPNTVRMDLYPLKDGIEVAFYQTSASDIDRIESAFRWEIGLKRENGGSIVVPEIVILGQVLDLAFYDIEVIAHDGRADMFQPGVLPHLDVLLSLGEQGFLSQVGFTWYDAIGTANEVATYYIELLATDQTSEQAYGKCGFVYYVSSGNLRRSGPVHIPADIRVLVSPDHILWRWICLGRNEG